MKRSASFKVGQYTQIEIGLVADFLIPALRASEGRTLVLSQQIEIKNDYNTLLKNQKDDLDARSQLFYGEVDQHLNHINTILIDAQRLLEERIASINNLEKRVNNQKNVILKEFTRFNGKLAMLKRELATLEKRMNTVKSSQQNAND